MARVLGVFPEPLPHRLSQAEVRAAICSWLEPGSPGRERLVEACERSGIEGRASLIPLGEVVAALPFTERNRRYAEAMVELGTAAASRALGAGGWRPERFHTIFVVSCTGVMIPSPDVHILARVGFLPCIRRLPVTELGCVGGAAALARAAEIVDAHPGSVSARGALGAADLAMVLSAEFSSLSFQRGDPSPGNVVSCMLFGDAVAALVLGPDGSAAPRGPLCPRVVATRSHVEPGTARHLGFDLRSSGFHIVLSREVPILIRELLRDLVAKFLSDLGWAREEVEHWVIHPGGEKVIRALLEALDLPPEKGDPSREVLREWGNASSAAVLLVLERVCRAARAGERGLVLGFGPGFSTELIALEW